MDNPVQTIVFTYGLIVLKCSGLTSKDADSVIIGIVTCFNNKYIFIRNYYVYKFLPAYHVNRRFALFAIFILFQECP